MTLPLVVVRGNKVQPLGRHWLKCIKLNWSDILALSATDPVKSLIDKYRSLSEKGNGKILNIKAHISLQEQAKPVFQMLDPFHMHLRRKVGSPWETS